jgi:uncharacterized membrane protein
VRLNGRALFLGVGAILATMSSSGVSIAIVDRQVRGQA